MAANEADDQEILARLTDGNRKTRSFLSREFTISRHDYCWYRPVPIDGDQRPVTYRRLIISDYINLGAWLRPRVLSRSRYRRVERQQFSSPLPLVENSRRWYSCRRSASVQAIFDSISLMLHRGLFFSSFLSLLGAVNFYFVTSWKLTTRGEAIVAENILFLRFSLAV